MKLRIKGQPATSEEFVDYVMGCYEKAQMKFPTCALAAVWGAQDSLVGLLVDAARVVFGWTYDQSFAFITGFDDTEDGYAPRYKTLDRIHVAADVYPEFYALGKQTRRAVAP